MRAQVAAHVEDRDPRRGNALPAQEHEVGVAVAALTSLMEPIMMVFLGGIVGGLIVDMYLPVFELAGNID